MTSQRTFRARHAAHAFAALRLTGLGLPLLSTPAEAEPRFLVVASLASGGGDCEALEPLESWESCAAILMTEGIEFLW